MGSATDSLQTATSPQVQQLNPGDISVLDKISDKLIKSDKDALRQKLNNLKEEYEKSKQSCFACLNQTKINDYKEKIRTIEHLLDNWENQNEYKAKISYGYRQIVVSRSSKTILSVEELTSFESDSHRLIKRINTMITNNSNSPNGDILKDLTDVKQNFLTFLNAVDSNNITDQNRKDLLDYQNRIELNSALKWN